MVRVWGANMSDVTDRSSRLLGEVYGYQDCTAEAVKLPIAGNDGVAVSPKPWWSRHGLGEICAMDDFEDVLKWTQVQGTVSKASDTTWVHEGNFAMKIVTGATAGYEAIARLHTMPLIYQWQYSCIELWWAFSAAAATTPRFFRILWKVQDSGGSKSWQFGLEYDHYIGASPQKKWSYLDHTGAFATIPYLNLSDEVAVTEPQFNYLLLQIRRSGNDYLYDFVQMNGKNPGTMTGVAGYEGTWDRGGQTIDISVENDADAVATLYVDAFTISNGVYTD